MYGEPELSPKHIESWLAVVSEVLAVLLSDTVTQEERERCRKLLAAWSQSTQQKLEHITFQISPDRKDKLPFREALPALHALVDTST